MSVAVWSMIGVAIWHFTIFVPDRFAGGIIGAFLAAWLGAVVSGFLFEGLTLPQDNPPGLRHVIWALPGSLVGLAGCWAMGTRSHRTRAEAVAVTAATSPDPSHLGELIGQRDA